MTAPLVFRKPGLQRFAVPATVCPMKQAIWTERYAVNSIVLNHQKRLGLVGLLQILQDVAWLHAQHLGHGYEAMIGQGTIWVLTRFQLVLSGPWPSWGQEMTIRTWVRPLTGALALRDYEILVDGTRIGEGTASWLTVDYRSRRPLKLSLNSDHPLACRTDGTLTLEPGKLPLQEGLPEVARFQVRNSDLDVNGHVNNTHYAQWILDGVPLATLDAYRLEHYEINFLAESHLGDTVILERGALEPLAGQPTRVQFQGRRAGDGKAIFVARIGARPLSDGDA